MYSTYARIKYENKEKEPSQTFLLHKLSNSESVIYLNGRESQAFISKSSVPQSNSALPPSVYVVLINLI